MSKCVFYKKIQINVLTVSASILYFHAATTNQNKKKTCSIARYYRAL